jgi:hypothetical protein
VFESLFLAGFECATGYNARGEWIDQIVATQHDRFADEDYALLRAAGIRVAREAVRWPLVDRKGYYDFASVRPFVEAARRHGVRLIFDLFHFGYPADVDFFSASFPGRFADYCYAAARWAAAQTEGPYFFTPINEPSYFAWAAGEVGLFAPYERGRGWELKICLNRAAIRGIEAIWAACPGARVVNVDALCRTVAPPGRPDLEREAERFNAAVFQSWDMLDGRLLPELGGSPEHLGTVGINYYWTNQWEIDRPGVPLSDTDPRRFSLRHLVRSVWERYGVDLMISETSHVGDMRSVWLRELTGEVEAALAEGVPLRGVCLYPILEMPEWHARDTWTKMGLWDLEEEDGKLRRVVFRPMMEELGEARKRLERWRARSTRRLTVTEFTRAFSPTR